MNREDIPKLIEALEDNIEIIHTCEKSRALIAETKMMFDMDENVVTAIDKYRELNSLQTLAEDSDENDLRRISDGR